MNTGTMAGHDGSSGFVIGGPARHVPVLLDAVLSELAPASGERHLDATFGAGGYSRALLAAGARVLALDRDPAAVAAAGAVGDGFRLVEARFSALDSVAEAEGFAPLDGVVLDIGVSSMQIDDGARGFSFSKDGPLDMRMGGGGPSAADAVNRLKAGDLARILSFLGEERHAGRIARAIETRRAERPFETTLDLANLVGRVVGRKPGDRIDPATRTFQGLRIFVNDELGELARALLAAERALKPGGRLVVVTFHSLEDRIVKRFFRERSTAPSASRHMPDAGAGSLTFLSSNRALAPSEAEVAANPRARSAKLRSATRTPAPPPSSPDPLGFAGLPSLVSLSLLGS